MELSAYKTLLPQQVIKISHAHDESSQEPLEAETDEECVPSNLALDFDTSHTDREEAVKESSVHSRARLRITLTQRDKQHISRGGE